MVGLGGTIVRLTGELDDTAVARWYRAARFRTDGARTGAGPKAQRLNWQTRTRYYETLVEELAATGGDSAEVGRDALAAKAGQRRPSTLYYLVSPTSPGSLAGVLLSATPHRLYEKRRGTRVLDLLVLEAKVWSYWPHREGWVEALDDLGVTDRWLAAAGLVRVVADWAACFRDLATAGGFAPPAAAVEDLLMLVDAADPAGARTRDDQLAEVTEILTTVVRTALGTGGIGPAFVLGVVHRRLAALVAAPRAAPDQLTTELADLLTQLEHLLPTLPDDDRLRMADELAPRLRSILTGLDRTALVASGLPLAGPVAAVAARLPAPGQPPRPERPEPARAGGGGRALAEANREGDR
jgi:hypothetical protein